MSYFLFDRFAGFRFVLLRFAGPSAPRAPRCPVFLLVAA
jgi:hypothetical protein